MAGLKRSRTIACPQVRTIRREERVSFAFKGMLSGNIDDPISSRLKPAAKVLLLTLSFWMKEAAHYDSSVVLESGIGGEDHVW